MTSAATDISARPTNITAVPITYHVWNSAILQHLARKAHAGAPLYLTITPAILTAISVEHVADIPPIDDASTSLVDAIREMYAAVVAPAGNLRVLLARNESSEPLAVAFLAASVLAAYGMQTDDEISALAYYKPLASLLNVELHGHHPLFFEPQAFEELWYDVALWLSEQNIGELVLPGSRAGRNRFVAYPLTHVPLRCVDTARLPQFFSWARYERGANVSSAHFESMFSRWSDIHRLSKPGREAFSDGRRQSVLAQIGLELRAWDGCVEETNGARIATVELHLDIVRNRPVLSYMGRRPQSFPAEFDASGATFHAGEEGWYEPLRVPHDHGTLLRDGIYWQHSGTPRLVLQRPGSTVIPFAPIELATGFISRRRLPIGVPSAVLVAESHVAALMEFVGRIAAKTPAAVRHPDLPEGWVLLRDVHVIRDDQPPGDLSSVELDHDLQIVTRGGLRIGRRWQWLRGASPQLVLVGAEVQHARIDNTEVPVIDGILHTNALEQAGIHVVEVPGVRQRVEIAEAAVSDLCVDILSPHVRRTVTLPRGAWTLIGRDKRTIATWNVGALGALVRAEFDPVWALSSVTDALAKIIFVGKSFDAPAPLDRRSVPATGLSWANAIYAANARRHQFGSIDAVSSEEIVDLWKRYASAAKELKRRVRRSRR
jgi:hypothetical protein